MHFDSTATTEQEIAHYSKFTNRAKKDEANGLARQRTLARFTNVAQDNPLFTPLAKLMAQGDGSHLQGIPRETRRRLGDTEVDDHEDSEFIQHPPAPSMAAASTSGIFYRGKLSQFMNGSAVGHRQTPEQAMQDRVGTPLSTYPRNDVIEMTPQDKVSTHFQLVC